MKDVVKLRWIDGILEICSSNLQNDAWIDGRYINSEIRDESVVEDILADGDKERTTKSLEENDDRGADGNVIERKDCLDSNETREDMSA